jgi:WhiB family redox-sensing transcriptional regulator
MADGACRTQDIPTEVFFPSRGIDADTPKAICAVCPVRVECLEYALEIAAPFGVWGGLSERERRRIRARRKRGATR